MVKTHRALEFVTPVAIWEAPQFIVTDVRVEVKTRVGFGINLGCDLARSPPFIVAESVFENLAANAE